MAHPAPPIAIRPAVAADVPSIAACAKAAYEPFTAAIGRAPAPMDLDYAMLVAAGHVVVATKLRPNQADEPGAQGAWMTSPPRCAEPLHASRAGVSCRVGPNAARQRDRAHATAGAGTGMLAGHAVFYERDGSMHLESVAVDPLHQGQGIGKALIAHVEGRAAARGLPAVDLYTNAVMTANAAMYGRLGYREIGTRVHGGYARVFFIKRLRQL